MPERETPLLGASAREYVRLLNPISSERVVMRQMLLPGVVEVAAANVIANQKQTEMRLDRALEELEKVSGNAKQAVLAFNGVVYEGLNASSLSNEDLDWAQRHLRILSGLYGLLRPLDLMQAYRLEMGTRLASPRGKNLYDYWGEKLTLALGRLLA